MPTRNPKSHKTVRDYLQVVNSVVSIWQNDNGPTALRATYIGLILAEAFYTPNPWVSAQYIVSRIRCISVDATRRLLEEMIDQGLVEFTEIDRKKVYRATPEAADSTVRAIAA